MELGYIHVEGYMYDFLRSELETAKERLAKKIENREIWIKDLVFCPEKYRFTMLHPEIVYQLEFSPKIVLGILMHKGYGRILEERGIVFEEDKEVELPIGEKTARGKIDIYIPDTNTIIELKDGKTYRIAPHHVLQVLLYKYAMKSSREILTIISTSKIVEVVLDEKDYNWALKEFSKAIPQSSKKGKIEITLATFTPEKYFVFWKSVKRPLWSWECSYCVFSDICIYAKKG